MNMIWQKVAMFFRHCCSVFLDNSFWRYLSPNNIYKLLEFIFKISVLLGHFFIPDLFSFQQDGMTPHSTTLIIDLTKGRFGESIFSRVSPINWPPRSRSSVWFISSYWPILINQKQLALKDYTTSVMDKIRHE